MVNAMDNSMLIGLATQRVLQRRMEIAANNLANVSTSGFKADLLITDDTAPRPAHSEETPTDVRFVEDMTVARDMRAGAITATGEPFDVAIDGDGFFMVLGPSGTLYTRSGAFTLSGEGALVTSAGYPVLDSGGAPIVFDAQGERPLIGRDGAISVAGVEVGRIGAAAFERPGALLKVGDSLWDAAGQEQSGFTGRIVQGALEGSNVSPVIELTRLIEISRAYENAARIVKSADDLRQETLERLGR
jgi:flagellar basal-body rod protein FlgF